METPKQRLEKIYSRYKTNASDIESRYKEKYPKTKFTKQTLYNIENGETKSISTKTAGILLEIFPDLNFIWLTTGKENNNPHILKNENKVLPAENAKQINESEDFIWLETYKVPEKAGLALSTNYFAESYINELEKGRIMVKKEHAGKYWEVEAKGDSMDDGTKRSMLSGDWYAARDIPRELWKDRLHLNAWNAFYFLHNEKGHIIKEVVSHDPETGLIELRSWNPDKEQYPDFTINIRDCYIVANIVKLVSRDYNIFYKK